MGGLVREMALFQERETLGCWNFGKTWPEKNGHQGSKSQFGAIFLPGFDQQIQPS